MIRDSAAAAGNPSQSGAPIRSKLARDEQDVGAARRGIGKCTDHGTYPHHGTDRLAAFNAEGTIIIKML